ncbi:hypothetical protein HYDPIDRAFT_113225 [Hydnomerulius pinastri MD-312]|uniref:Uncharacterized protein n=1 Tax=Hydnomerulius pinastri MD-312 TaxID=994086 RepID=A0A0C9W7P0_9AGAM|nr:hypothetical protein HYDPIDRAFT_113225 [Hydnomerulius pinastri MD-312]
MWSTNRLLSPDFSHSLAEGPFFPLKSTPFTLGSLFIHAVRIIPSPCSGPRQRVGLLALLPELFVPVADSSHSRPSHRTQQVSEFILQTTTTASALARSSSTKRKIHKKYSQRGWIPLVVDKAGNYIRVDLNPGEGGNVDR